MAAQTSSFDFILDAVSAEHDLNPYLQLLAPDGNLTLVGAREAVAGLGVRLGITSNLSLKLGVDAWTSRPTSKPPVTIDWFGHAGLSLFF